MLPRASHAIVAAAALFLAGCATGTALNVQPGPVPVAAPPSGKAQIIFYRPSALGMLVECTIRENGKMMGRAGDGRYFILSADPGPHVFTAKTEITDTLRMDVQPDETKYVRCNIRMGILVGRPHLVPSNAEEFARFYPNLKMQDTKKMAEEIAKDEARQAKVPSREPPEH